MRLRDIIRAHRREFVAALLMLLPPVLLIPLGALWLWQQGHVFWFLALGLLGAMPAGLLLMRRTPSTPPDATKAVEAEVDWPAREREAFASVERYCDTVEPISLIDPDQAFAVARHTVELVAKHYRPDAAMPLAAFTVPEALLLAQRVSARLRQTILEFVPLSDRLTLAELIWASRTFDKVAPLYDLGRIAYDAYRSVRLVVNPAGALMGELGKIIFDKSSDKAADWLQRRLTRILVLEVGKTAIELYSGRLKSDEAELARIGTAMARAGALPSGDAPPLRILIAGQVNAGKSSLLNALARDIHAPVSPLPGPPGFACFEAKDPEGRAFVLVDAPGLVSAPDAIGALVKEAQKADIVLWCVAAHQAAFDIDASGLGAFRDWFAARPDLNRPPLLCVMTHIDQLRPFSEWEPPYDIANPAKPKEKAIRGATEAVAADLSIDVEAIVPVCLSPERGVYNLDALWARIGVCLSGARYAQLARAHATRGTTSWWGEAGRLVKAGRTLFRQP